SKELAKRPRIRLLSFMDIGMTRITPSNGWNEHAGNVTLPARFTHRYAAIESSRRPALGCIFAHDGPGRRPVEVSERNFFAELKRRNVYKVAVAYAVIAWLLVQVATQVFPFLEIPNWVVRLVIALVVIGFPIALVIAWAFEATPQGIQRTEVADAALEQSRGKTWIYVVVIAAAISIGLFFLGRYTARTPRQSETTVAQKSIAVLPFESLS